MLITNELLYEYGQFSSSKKTKKSYKGNVERINTDEMVAMIGSLQE